MLNTLQITSNLLKVRWVIGLLRSLPLRCSESDPEKLLGVSLARRGLCWRRRPKVSLIIYKQDDIPILRKKKSTFFFFQLLLLLPLTQHRCSGFVIRLHESH